MINTKIVNASEGPTRGIMEPEPFPYLNIENLFSNEERKVIFQELEFFNKPGVLEEASREKGAAASKSGGLLKSSNSEYLNNIVHPDKAVSTIRMLQTRSIEPFYDKETDGFPENKSPSWFFDNVGIGKDLVFSNVSYYEDGQYYKPHRDSAALTSLTWFFKDSDKCSGGELYFPNYDLTIEVYNGLTIVFPSIIVHEVKPVHVEKEFRGKGYGRYCVAVFGGGS